MGLPLARACPPSYFMSRAGKEAVRRGRGVEERRTARGISALDCTLRYFFFVPTVPSSASPSCSPAASRRPARAGPQTPPRGCSARNRAACVHALRKRASCVTNASGSRWYLAGGR